MKAFVRIGLFTLGIMPAWGDWVVESKYESGDTKIAIVTKVQGDKLRIERRLADGSESFIFYNVKTGDSAVAWPVSKSAVLTSGAERRRMQEEDKLFPASSPGGPGKVERTGEKETVSGIECEIWNWSYSPNNTTRLWVASGHPQATALREVFQKIIEPVPKTVRTVPEASLLPGPILKWVAGTRSETVLAVKEVAVAASEFEIPPDYAR